MQQKKLPVISPIQQSIKQFHTNTQLKKTVIQIIDTYLANNKQAFSYIDQWSNKFIDIQSRVSKTQSSYIILQSNINTKLDLLNIMNTRLDKFVPLPQPQNQQFWKQMKQYQQYLQNIRKNYYNLTRQTGAHTTSLKLHQKQFSSLHAHIQSIQKFTTQQFAKLNTKLSNTQALTTTKANKLLSSTQNLLLQLSTNKSQFDYKFNQLTQLLQDLTLYKNQKNIINSHLNTIFQQLNTRVLNSDLALVKTHIDNIQAKNKKIINVIKDKLQKQTKSWDKQKNQKNMEMFNLKRSVKQSEQTIKNIKNQNNQKNLYLTNQLNIISTSINTLSTNLQKITKIQNQLNQIKQLNNTQSLQISQISHLSQKINQLSTFNIKNTHKFQSLQKTIKQLQTRLQTIKNDHEEQNNLSNTSAYNNNPLDQPQNPLDKKTHQLQTQLLLSPSQLQKSNKSIQKKNKLFINASIIAFNHTILQKFQKLQSQQSQHFNLYQENHLKMLQMFKTSQHQFNNYKYQNKQLLERLDNKFTTSLTQLSKTLTSSTTHLSTTLANLQSKMHQAHQTLLSQTQHLLDQTIQKMQQKLELLTIINKNLQSFKQQYHQQLIITDNLNRQIKQKMQRIFGAQTKLKSDIFIKIQNLNNQQNRLLNKYKQSMYTNQDICQIISQMYQFINIILCIQMWTQSQNQQFLPHQTLTSQYPSLTKSQQQQHKLASLTQGWILQLTKSSTKYRGESTTKLKLLQLTLQQCIKYGDKIKTSDGLISNGKDIFMKMIQGNYDYHQFKKRSNSKSNKRINSKNKIKDMELPKVYK